MFRFHQILPAEVALGPRLPVNDYVRFPFTSVSLQLSQPSWTNLFFPGTVVKGWDPDDLEGDWLLEAYGKRTTRIRRGIGKEREWRKKEGKLGVWKKGCIDISADICLPQGHMHMIQLWKSTETWNQEYSEWKDIDTLTIHVGGNTSPPTHTHTYSHTETHFLEQSPYPLHCHHLGGEPGAMEVAETAFHLQMFFLSEKFVFDFCSKQTYPTKLLFWLPSPTNRQTFPLVTLWD